MLPRIDNFFQCEVLLWNQELYCFLFSRKPIKQSCQKYFLKNIRLKQLFHVRTGVDGISIEELAPSFSKNGKTSEIRCGQKSISRSLHAEWKYRSRTEGGRNLGVPTVVDRFVQRAVAQVYTLIYEKQFHDHSYGFRPNRCTQQAFRRRSG